MLLLKISDVVMSLRTQNQIPPKKPSASMPKSSSSTILVKSQKDTHQYSIVTLLTSPVSLVNFLRKSIDDLVRKLKTIQLKSNLVMLALSKWSPQNQCASKPFHHMPLLDDLPYVI